MKGSILIVEDNRYHMDGFIEALAREDYLLMPYLDAQEAIQEIRIGLKYDLAIFDISHKNVSVEDLINESKEKNPEVPILTISGYAKRFKKTTDFIEKPIIGRELVEIINHHFENNVKPKVGVRQ